MGGGEGRTSCKRKNWETAVCLSLLCDPIRAHSASQFICRTLQLRAALGGPCEAQYARFSPVPGLRSSRTSIGKLPHLLLPTQMCPAQTWLPFRPFRHSGSWNVGGCPMEREQRQGSGFSHCYIKPQEVSGGGGLDQWFSSTGNFVLQGTFRQVWKYFR